MVIFTIIMMMFYEQTLFTNHVKRLGCIRVAIILLGFYEKTIKISRYFI